MSGGIYSGEDISAVVIDAGHHSLRIGISGEEVPKFDISSRVGVRVPADGVESKERELIVDENAWRAPIGGVEIKSIMADGVVSDFDMFESMLAHVYKHKLVAESKEHPVLMSEPAWSTKLYRERLTEFMFETQDVPALFLGKAPVLVCFSNGRSSGLVFDSGEHCTSASPVLDGYVLGNAVVKSSLAGAQLTQQCRHMFAEQKIVPVPAYQIGTKRTVRNGERPVWSSRKLPSAKMHPTYHTYMQDELIGDFARTILHASDTPYNAGGDKLAAIPYEFPNGLTHDFHDERFKVAESMFDTAFLQDVDKSTVIPMAQIAATSINMCDIDIRPQMYQGVLVTGGNTLINGFVQRLHNDLSNRCPGNCKLRVINVPTAAERRYGAWTGGSILASLGTFQQMWISRSEYEESGKSVVERKCP